MREDEDEKSNRNHDVPKAPISSTATIVPTSRAVGLLKYFRKYGPVMIPLMTLLRTELGER